jgi:hypothetical protein
MDMPKTKESEFQLIAEDRFYVKRTKTAITLF